MAFDASIAKRVHYEFLVLCIEVYGCFYSCGVVQEMLERQLEYERVRLEAESRKACLESQEKVGLE